jgi:hypothetical protein
MDPGHGPSIIIATRGLSPIWKRWRNSFDNFDNIERVARGQKPF